MKYFAPTHVLASLGRNKGVALDSKQVLGLLRHYYGIEFHSDLSEDICPTGGCRDVQGDSTGGKYYRGAYWRAFSKVVRQRRNDGKDREQQPMNERQEKVRHYDQSTWELA